MDLQSLYKDIVSSYGTGKYNGMNNLNTLFNTNNNTNTNNTNNILNTNSNNTILDSNTPSPVSQQQSTPPVDVNWDDYLGKLSQYQTSQAEQNAQAALTDNPFMANLKKIAGGTLSTVPKTQQEFLDYYGKAPEGGWTDQNTYGGKQDRTLQGWLDNPDLLPKFDLYGSGSQEDLQKGFNVLQHYAPRNINEFWSLSPDVQKAMLQHPDAALTYMQKLGNKANEDWLSVDAEGGFKTPEAYGVNQQGQFTIDPKQYVKVNDGGLLSGIYNVMDPFLDTVDPLFHQNAQDLTTDTFGFEDDKQAFSTIAPIILDMFFPGAGSAVGAADAASRGDMLGAVVGAAGAGLGATGAYPSMTGNALYDKMLTKGFMGAGSGILSGASGSDILRNAALSGLSAYNTNPLMSQLFGTGDLGSAMLSAGTKSGLSQLFKNNEIDPAQLAIAIGGAGLNNYMRG